MSLCLSYYKEWRAGGNSKMEFSEEKGTLNFDLRLWKSKGRALGGLGQASVLYHAIYAPVVMKKVKSFIWNNPVQL